MASLALAVLAVPALALPLSDYNLILSGDYNFQGGEVEGRTLIGGNLNASGHSPAFGTRMQGLSPAQDSLTVVGDTRANNLHINNGGFTYGGTLELSDLEADTGSSGLRLNSHGSVTGDPGLAFDSVFSALRDGSQGYKSLAANGEFIEDRLTYSGAAGSAVFDVKAEDVFAQNTSLKLDAGLATTVIVNVAGKQVTAGGGTNLTEGFTDVWGKEGGLGASNILWNFYEAEAIDFGNLAMKGSVLAPYASITGGGGQFDGSVAARSYRGDLEFHKFNFNPPEVTVPEPGTLLLLATGLGLLVLGRRRRGA